VAIYAKFGSIKRKINVTGLEGWVELDSFNWGYTGTKTQGHGPAQYQDVAVGEFLVTMKAERASVDLAQLGLNCANIGIIECPFTATRSSKVDTYMSYKFTNCMIDRHGIAADPHGVAVETFALSFQALNFTFTACDLKPVSVPTSVSFDLASLATS
jgi:type VI protein secretion system component Hcp